MFYIMLTEITSFDFDYIGAAVLILEQHLLTLLSQMQCFNLRADCTIRGGHIWNKYGLVLISMLYNSDLYILCRRKRQPLHG